MAHRPRPLNHSEIALWREVTKSIRPLYDRFEDLLEPEVPAAAPVAQKAVTPAPIVASQPVAAPKPVAKVPKLLPLAPIERPLLRKISRGQNEIDAVLDLHGMRQHEAHERLRRFLQQSQFNHARLVLVVTGKGNSPSKTLDGEGHGKGVLRRLVPDWLRMPDLRPVVMGFEQAAPHQGGSGALYVRLRKRRLDGEHG
jgi:DNA-nicking Smr family endonuclease